MGTLYLIHFGDPQRYYIGATTLRPAQRRNKHLKAFRLRRHSALMQAEFDKHGEAAMQFVPLREVPDSQLLDREAEMLVRLKPPLNEKYGYAAIGRRLGIDDATVKRRAAAGLDPLAAMSRATLRPYKVEVYDVGLGRTMSAQQIINASGASAGTVYRRIKDGVRGPALLAQTARGRPCKGR